MSKPSVCVLKSYNFDFHVYKIGDLTRRRSLREQQNCKSFEWYLNNVYTTMVIPWDIQNHVSHFGRLRSLAFEAVNDSRKMDICLAMTEIPENERSSESDNDHQVFSNVLRNDKNLENI